MVGRIGCGGNTLALRRRGEAMTLSPSLRVRRGSSSALRTRLDGNEPGCHVRTRTGARGSKSRPRSSPTTSLRAVAGPRSSFPAHRPRLPQRDPQACRSYSLLYSRNESGGETRIGPLTNREVFVTESELGRAALSLASFFVAKHFTPSPFHSHPLYREGHSMLCLKRGLACSAMQS